MTPEQIDEITTRMSQAMLLVIAERERQIEKWGDESHQHPLEWLAILTEEIGELAEAINETHFNSEHAKPELGGIEAIRREAVHVAAVAMAIVESALNKEEGNRVQSTPCIP